MCCEQAFTLASSRLASLSRLPGARSPSVPLFFLTQEHTFGKVLFLLLVLQYGANSRRLFTKRTTQLDGKMRVGLSYERAFQKQCSACMLELWLTVFTNRVSGQSTAVRHVRPFSLLSSEPADL